MSRSKVSQIAREEMESGNNCCQAVLLAARKAWGIPVGEDLLAAAKLFGGGMGSGCSCGALTGMIMAAGIMNRYHPHPDSAKLPQQLHDQFKQEFGSTCCRVIKKRRSVIDKIGKKACVELTGKTAGILFAAWEGIIDAPIAESIDDINNNSNPE